MNYKLGDLIEQSNERNSLNLYVADNVVGISTDKKFIATKANLEDVNLMSYKLVKPQFFAYVPDTSRRGDKISLAFNHTENTYLVSSISLIFQVKKTEILLPEFLFMFFNRSEFDRYSRFHSWGSAREAFSWDDMCNISLNLPPLEIQQKAVAVYQAMLANQRAYEQGLDDLKLVCDGYIEHLKKTEKLQELGSFIREVEQRNTDLSVTLAQGINVDMEFIPPKRIAEDIANGKIVRKGQFAYNKVMKAGGTKLPIALRRGEDCVISSSYQVFEVVDKDKILPDFLMLWLSRSETQRYAGFISWGSTRDIFSYDELEKLKIPIPDLSVQQAIVNIYQALLTRRQINDQLKQQIKNICPVLVRGAAGDFSA